MPVSERQTIADLISRPRTVAVVGLSPKPHRESFKVSQYMQRQGWRIVPINPNASEILGEKVYSSLTEAAAAEKIDLVNVFRNSEDVPPVVDEALGDRRTCHLAADWAFAMTRRWPRHKGPACNVCRTSACW